MSKSLLTGIRERGFVRISAYWGETSAQYLDPDSGEPAGLVGLVGQLLAHDLGVKPEFVNMVWEDHIDALLSDQVDISIKHTNTPERAFNVEFTIESILCEEGRIVILSSNDLKKEADLNQAHRIISVAMGSSQEVHVRERYPLAQVKILTDSQETFDAVLNGQADACLHDTKVPGFLSLHTECTILTKDDGQPIIPYKDCVHPCIKPGDQRFLNWLNSWMSFNKATGKFDRIMNEVEVVHKEKFDRLVTK